MRVDLMTSISGVSWDEVSSGSESGTYGDTPIFFIGRKQLLSNKRATNRVKDQADIEALGEE